MNPPPVAPPASPPVPMPGLWSRRRFLGGLAAGGAAGALPWIWVKAGDPGKARGTVFHDRDGSGRRGADSPGVEGVFVSNGRDVVATDAAGRWELPLLPGPATDFFVVKPRGWRTPVSADALPRHFRLHQPEGSPVQRYPGVAATGSLPESVDFPLLPQEEGDGFRMLVCGDPQPRDLREVDYIARTAPGPLREAGGDFGVNLGDIAFDDLSLYSALNGVFASAGPLWHNVLGNHDINLESRDDVHGRETFRSVYGPTYYSFNHGPVHFVVLDNIEWTGADPQKEGSRGSYRGALGQRQLEWLAADLALVPREQPLVLFMHIPLRDEGQEKPGTVTADRRDLYRLLEGRPRTLSFSSHRHYHRHDFIDAADGWTGEAPHHHIIVGSLCGSWFRGLPDFGGTPHGTMSDGTPRGFLAVDFEGEGWSIDGYRVLGAPHSRQMHIHVADVFDAETAAGQAFHVNFYNGSARSRVRARLGEGDVWRELEKVDAPDPAFVALRGTEGELEAPWRTLPAPSACSHLWQGALPEGLKPGTYALEVLAEDGFGHSARALRSIRLEG